MPTRRLRKEIWYEVIPWKTPEIQTSKSWMILNHDNFNNSQQHFFFYGSFWVVPDFNLN